MSDNLAGHCRMGQFVNFLRNQLFMFVGDAK